MFAYHERGAEEEKERELSLWHFMLQMEGCFRGDTVSLWRTTESMTEEVPSMAVPCRTHKKKKKREDLIKTKIKIIPAAMIH